MSLDPAGFQQQVATLLDSWIQKSDLVGFAAGYATYDETEGSDQYLCYLGQVKDQFTGATGAPTDSTLWELDSCTKSVTAALFALQVTAGQVQPSGSVGGYLAPYFPGGSSPSELQNITLEQLAAMNAGLAGDCTSSPPYFRGGDPCNLFTYLQGSGSYGPAGSFSYSDLSYALLSYAMVASATTPLPSCSGLPGTLLSQYGTQLFQPLEMTSPVFYPARSGSGYTFPYGIRESGGAAVETTGNNPNWPAFAGAGGLLMTAPDFLTWLRANMGAVGDTSPLGSDELLFLRSAPFSTDCRGKPWIEGQHITRGWFLDKYIGQYSGRDRHIYTKHGSVPGFFSGVAYRDSSTPGSPPSGSPSSPGVFLLTNCGVMGGGELVTIIQQLMDYVIEQ